MSDSRRAAASSERLRLLAAARWRVALALTFAMMAVYFGFILLVAFDKPLLARHDRAGPERRDPARRGRHRHRVDADLPSTWCWANRHYDAAIATLRSER